MSLYHNNQKLSIEDAKKYNLDTRQCQSTHHGCITSLACIHCGLVVHDTLCLCVGNFMCPGCGQRNGLTGWPVENFKFPADYLNISDLNISGLEKLSPEERALEKQYAEEYAHDYQSYLNKKVVYEELIWREGRESERGKILLDLLNRLISEYDF